MWMLLHALSLTNYLISLTDSTTNKIKTTITYSLMMLIVIRSWHRHYLQASNCCSMEELVVRVELREMLMPIPLRWQLNQVINIEIISQPEPSTHPFQKRLLLRDKLSWLWLKSDQRVIIKSDPNSSVQEILRKTSCIQMPLTMQWAVTLVSRMNNSRRGAEVRKDQQWHILAPRWTFNSAILSTKWVLSSVKVSKRSLNSRNMPTK